MVKIANKKNDFCHFAKDFLAGRGYKVTLKDIRVTVEDQRRQDGNYTKAHQTKLYNENGCAYCTLLCLMSANSIGSAEERTFNFLPCL